MNYADIIQSHTGYAPQGVDCKFYPIDNDLAIKAYHTEETRDLSYNQQTYWAGRGYAPKTYEKFNLTINGVVKYCFITERVVPISNPGENNSEHITNNCKAWDLHKLEITAFCSEIETVYGMLVMDNHAGNFGRNKVGDLVCLDFSCEWRAKSSF